MNPLLLTVSEAARELRMSICSVRRLSIQAAFLAVWHRFLRSAEPRNYSMVGDGGSV